MQAQTIVAAIHRPDNQIVLVNAPAKVIPVYRKRTYLGTDILQEEFLQCTKQWDAFTPSTAQ